MALRTQENRYWVQVEMEANGAATGAAFIDLNMVEEVTFTRAPKPDNPDYVDKVQVVSSAQIKPLLFINDNANWFYSVWVKYITLNDVCPAAKPGLIQTVRSAKGLSPMAAQ